MRQVAIVGNGQLARGVAAALAERPDVTFVGPTDRDQQAAALCSGADVVVIATTTRLLDVTEAIETAIAHGSNVIVSAEESAHPWSVDDEAATRLDSVARKRGVTVLGCGLNPGFVFDALVLTMLGVCVSFESIAVSRTVDLSAFGSAVRARLGLGFDEAAFRRGVLTGQIMGHAGFPQSMAVVAAALGVTIERIDTEIDPIMRDGLSVGVRQVYTAIVGGADWYRATFRGHTDMAGSDLEVRDEIEIVGATPVRVVLEPGIPSQSGSQAMIANSVDRVIDAPPGWLTVADLRPAHPSLPHVRHN